MWQSWTPTVTQSGSVTITIVYAQYTIIGNAVSIIARLSVTGSGTIANAIVIGGVPVAIRPSIAVDSYSMIGEGFILNTTASVHYHGALMAFGATDWRIITDGSNNFLGANPSFALASGHVIALQATYPR